MSEVTMSSAFTDAFRAYVQFGVTPSRAKATDRDREKVRTEMLRAFQEFLTASGVGPNREVHFELMAKMTDFAKGKDKSGPRA
jgi:hypothetical protein